MARREAMMVYLFDDGDWKASTAPEMGEVTDLLCPFELIVISMARLDKLDTLERTSWLQRAITLVFGLPSSNRLANKRLETLRRYAVLLYRASTGMDADAERSMSAAGFSLAQIEAVRSCVCLFSSVGDIGWRRHQRMKLHFWKPRFIHR